jgi:hypothetical protein
VELTGAVTISYLKRSFLKRFIQCHVFTQSPPGRRPSDKYAPLLICVKMFSFAVVFDSNGSSYIISTQPDICLCVHPFFLIKRRWTGKRS